jgi:cell division septum initiation protein DivIVA
VSPVAVGIGVALVAAVVIWLMACVQRRPPSEEAQRILEEARNEAREIVAAAKATAAEITREAERSAGDIVKTAEERSWDLVAAGELQKTLARREAIRVQELADGVRSDLGELVSSLLAEVERASEAWSVNGHSAPNGAPRTPSGVGSK